MAHKIESNKVDLTSFVVHCPLLIFISHLKHLYESDIIKFNDDECLVTAVVKLITLRDFHRGERAKKSFLKINSATLANHKTEYSRRILEALPNT